MESGHSRASPNHLNSGDVSMTDSTGQDEQTVTGLSADQNAPFQGIPAAILHTKLKGMLGEIDLLYHLITLKDHTAERFDLIQETLVHVGGQIVHLKDAKYFQNEDTEKFFVRRICEQLALIKSVLQPFNKSQLSRHSSQASDPAIESLEEQADIPDNTQLRSGGPDIPISDMHSSISAQNSSQNHPQNRSPSVPVPEWAHFLRNGAPGVCQVVYRPSRPTSLQVLSPSAVMLLEAKWQEISGAASIRNKNPDDRPRRPLHVQYHDAYIRAPGSREYAVGKSIDSKATDSNRYAPSEEADLLHDLASKIPNISGEYEGRGDASEDASDSDDSEDGDDLGSLNGDVTWVERW